ncbi:MAG: ComEC/Rec2 family competence protein, partial [Nitrospirae bacterium]|nr:ComEC/Rec2 family competence protein [Nitrospirota bacterium]
VIWNPDALRSLSFQLSFLAILFIGFSVGYMEDKDAVTSKDTEDKRLFLRFFTSGLRIFRTSLLLTLAASVGTAPLVAYHFHYFSLISPLSNLLVTPLIGFVLLPLSLFSAFIFLLTGHYVFAPLVKVAADISVSLVMAISRFPFADIKIPAFPAIVGIFFYVGVVSFLISNRKRESSPSPSSPPIEGGEITTKSPLPLRERVRVRGIIVFLLPPMTILIIYLFISIFQKKPDISITYLDVGQGDAAVVETSKGNIIVIDTGKTGRELEAYLRYKGKKAVDTLIITHADNDHSGGVQRVIKKFKVKEVWDNGLLIYPDGILKNVIHRSLERGDEISLEGITIMVFHPYKGFYTYAENESASENNYSLVVKITGKKSFLFTGDVEEEAEEDMAHLNRWLKSDVIKVPHHGGRTSANQNFLNVVSSEIAVISVGKNNPYGHPHASTIEMLGNAKICRTDRDGAVKISEKDGQLEVKTYKDFQFAKTGNLNGEIRNLKRLFEVW